MLMLNGKEVCRVVYIPKSQPKVLQEHIDKLDILRGQGKIVGYGINPLPISTHVCVQAILA